MILQIEMGIDGNTSLLYTMRHRRLAKAGSPATARGCGELWRALLAAAVAVVVDFHWMGVFCRKVEARRMELEARY